MLLHVKRYSTTTEDGHGNSVPVYAAATEWTVRGIAPGAMSEPFEPDREASEVAWTVYASKSDDAPTERDLVVLDDLDYTVNGRAKDWTRGPFPNSYAGIVVELSRVEG